MTRSAAPFKCCGSPVPPNPGSSGEKTSQTTKKEPGQRFHAPRTPTPQSSAGYGEGLKDPGGRRWALYPAWVPQLATKA